MCKQSNTQDGTTLVSVGTEKLAATEIPSHGRRASCTRIAPASRPPAERAGGDLEESDGDDSECENEPPPPRSPHL